MAHYVKPGAFGYFTIFVRDVDETEEDDLRKDCERFGEVTGILRKEGTSPNVFVYFASKEQGGIALRALEPKWNVSTAQGNRMVRRSSRVDPWKEKCSRNEYKKHEDDGVSTTNLVPAQSQESHVSELTEATRQLHLQEGANASCLPPFIDDGSDSLPEHLNELIVFNLSTNTTANDLMLVFGLLNPVHVSEPTFFFLSRDTPCRIVRFQHAKAVTFALKHWRNKIKLHGKVLSFHRLSSFLENFWYL